MKNHPYLDRPLRTPEEVEAMRRRCDSCRFWSEMIAKAEGGGGVEAFCLSSKSQNHGRYTTGRQTCDAWKADTMGAVDAPPDYGASLPDEYREG